MGQNNRAALGCFSSLRKAEPVSTGRSNSICRQVSPTRLVNAAIELISLPAQATRKVLAFFKPAALVAGGFTVLSPTLSWALAINNADFADQAGEWASGEGPPGWTLVLDQDEQRGIVADVDFALSGNRAFRFSALGTGFGASRLDQCVTLDPEPDALRLSVQVRAEAPDPGLALRLRVDFYADDACDADSANAAAEQIETDVSLGEDRAPADQWQQIGSAIRLPSELGDDVRSARISLRLRDRSDGGQPSDPVRVVWFDQVSLQADISLLPAEQRAALRDLYLATNGPEWRESLGWMDAEGTECRWHGVRCSPDGSNLIGLDLSANGLLGELPASITALSDLQLDDGLDLCWNDILVNEAELGFVEQRHLGGDPGSCQGIDLLPINSALSGNYFQPIGRDGEGFSLNMLGEGAAVLFWATYDDVGEPLWLIGTGRADQRVMRFPDLLVTRLGGDGFSAERVGSAALGFTPAEVNDEHCALAILRFSADGDSFGARDGRELISLDGLTACPGARSPDQLVDAIAGIWFDPALVGQGLSFTPHGEDRVVLNWFGYDEEGEQVWRLGVGFVEVDDRLLFDDLLAVRGGSFNGPISPQNLSFDREGSAVLTPNENGWSFELNEPDGRQTELNLLRIEAGPDLLASTGRRVDLEIADVDLVELYTRSPFSDDRLPGQARLDGSDQVLELNGLRFRGSSSRLLPKKSFNIRFEGPQPLLFGSDRMNLNSMYTDPSMVREALSFELFDRLGQPAPWTRYFDLWINGIYEGTYLHIQRVDETLLAQNGLNPNGTLVRDQLRGSSDGPQSSFGFDLASLPEDERLDFIVDNFDFRGDPEWEELLALIEWVQATPPGVNFELGFEQRFDVDNFIDWLVLHWLIGDIDAFADDYWLYLDHDDPDGRWRVIPWDKDLSFGSHFREEFSTTNDFFNYEYPLRGGWGNLLIERFLETPALRSAAEARLLQLVNEVFPPSWFDTRVDELIERLHDSINIQPGPGAFMVHDQNHFSTPDLFADQVEAVLEFVSLRGRFIERQIASEAGELDRAMAQVSANSTERVFLTDVSGWTLATVQVLTPSPVSRTLVMSVVQDETLIGIDREWILDLVGGPLSVELSLYYRNEISNSWGRGNWWTEGDEPIGEQHQLRLMFGPEGGELQEVEDTRINPVANMARAQVELTQGRQVLRLVLPPVDQD